VVEVDAVQCERIAADGALAVLGVKELLSEATPDD
jgi:hypothetical protein